MTRVRGLSRGVTRVIAVATAVWCLGLLARAVESSCVLAGTGVVDGAEAGLTAGAATITSIREIARFSAELLSVPSVLAAGGLAAVALGSLLVILRSRSDKAGATFAALAVYGALALSRTEITSILDGTSHSVTHMLARLGLVVGSCVLAWCWIEDVALAASLAPSDDPHEVDPAADREAAHIAKHGPMHGNAASRRLHEVLRSEPVANEPGLHGRGSPIPRFMPTHDEPVATAE